MAAVSTGIGLVVGIAIGLVAAYARNALDDVLMRAMDVIMAFPQIMLALVAVSLLGAKLWIIIAGDRADDGTPCRPCRTRRRATRRRARLRRRDGVDGRASVPDPVW